MRSVSVPGYQVNKRVDCVRREGEWNGQLQKVKEEQQTICSKLLHERGMLDIRSHVCEL
jgi:hypothetical protein